ncbi:MAG: hypothetical protein U9R41_05285 [Candidatus Marinimicrobia bacterium]|nr:hypothetical protein [Candidatus Neomarinimicrobiota bacterium]
MKKIIFLIIIAIFTSSCNLWKKEIDAVIEWKIVSEQGKNTKVPAGLRYKTFSIKNNEHKVFKKKDFIKEINKLNIDNLELILNKNQKNRWRMNEKNLKNITFEIILPENDKKQEYIKLIIPIIYNPYQVIFTDIVDGGINRDDVYNNIKKVADNNELYTYITNGIVKISTKDDQDCWKKLYTITETSLFNKIFDRINDFYDELFVSDYYSEVEDYDVHLLLSKYVFKFDNEKFKLLDKQLDNHKNINTKIYIPELNFQNDDILTNYENLEISFVDSSKKDIIKIYDNK